MRKIIIFLALIVLLTPLVSSSYATTREISILTGAADPHVSRTFSPPTTNAVIGDVIQWGNGDTVSHSVTSGIPGKPDGRFDSGPLDPGKYFSYTLNDRDLGVIPFYDKTYPWMTGTLNVQLTLSGNQSAQSNYKVIKNVGADAGDGKHTFDVQYQSIKQIISSSINAKDKSVTFTLVGKVQGNSTLVLNLPTRLIDGPLLVWKDNVQTDDYTVISQGGINVVTVPIGPLTESISIVGTSVVPEFGPLAGIVLSVAIIATIAFTRFRLGHRSV